MRLKPSKLNKRKILRYMSSDNCTDQIKEESNNIILNDESLNQLKNILNVNDRNIDTEIDLNKLKIISEGNTIRFYEYIDKNSAILLNHFIDTITQELLIEKTKYNFLHNKFSNNQKDIEFCINLHIFSPGGDVSSSFAIADKIVNNPIPINTIIEGEVASGATIISVCGHNRYAHSNSIILLHQLRGGCFGTYSEIKDDMYNMDITNKQIINWYKKYCKLTEEELHVILNNEREFNVEEALTLNIIDKII